MLKGSALAYNSQSGLNCNEKRDLTHSLPSAKIASPLVGAFIDSPKTGTDGKISHEGENSSYVYEFKQGECFGELASSEYNSK